MKRVKMLILTLSMASLTLLGCNDNDSSEVETPITMTSSAEIARGFYQNVIVNKDMSKFDNYIGTVYDQHATGYADGVEPLRTELAVNAADTNTKVTILRVVGEGKYAALHSLWESNGVKTLYVDIWKVENNKLVAHWDQFQVVPTTTPVNSNTMYLGADTNTSAGQNIVQNKTRALAVLGTFDNLNDLSPIQNFVSGKTYIQHNPTVADGKQAFMDMFIGLKNANVRLKTTVAKTIAMGDMVLIHSKQIDLDVVNDKGTGYIDIFRFDKDGQIVEHWDIAEVLTGISLNKNDAFAYPD